MSRKKKSKREHRPNSPRGTEGTVVLEFFDERNGEDQFTLELTQADFARYEEIARERGITIEELMVQVAEREIEERNTQWVLPTVDSFGRLDLANGTPMDLSNIADRKEA